MKAAFVALLLMSFLFFSGVPSVADNDIQSDDLSKREANIRAKENMLGELEASLRRKLDLLREQEADLKAREETLAKRVAELGLREPAQAEFEAVRLQHEHRARQDREFRARRNAAAAAELVGEGDLLAKDREYAKALEKYEQAYKIAPSEEIEVRRDNARHAAKATE
jgi:Skp family chaperone for outer membrane proteins